MLVGQVLPSAFHFTACNARRAGAMLAGLLATSSGEFAMDKLASVKWQGRGKAGIGHISTETQALRNYPYGFGSRFGDDRTGTNPEELLGAAHAACFTMAFSFACDKAGFATEAVKTSAKVSLNKAGDGFEISAIHLTLEARIPGIDEPTFQRIAATAKSDCPVSKALKGVAGISLQATLQR
jgi:lipoyl-dependent peroxiredoxin